MYLLETQNFSEAPRAKTSEFLICRSLKIYSVCSEFLIKRSIQSIHVTIKLDLKIAIYC